MSAAASSLDCMEVLVALAPNVPVPWRGVVVDGAAAGPVCTQRPAALTIWAPAGCRRLAFCLLAMCKSAAPEDCLVLTDELPPLDAVPADGRIAAVERGGRGPIHAGEAPFACRDLRSDRIFRWLLTGRVRRRPELEPLLHLHLLTGTSHGQRVLERWSEVLPVLFGGGLPGMMPEELRSDLEELAGAARLGERAFTGGFHLLDPLVRGPAEWEAGARTYLTLAAAQSPGALAAVEHWLDRTAGWHLAPPHLQERRRLLAARLLHRLVDDPWLSGGELAALLAEDGPR